MNIHDKELAEKAIADYEPYTRSQKKLLITLMNICIDNSVTTSITALSKMIGFTRAMSYKSIEALEKDEAIRKIGVKQARVSTFELNQTRIKYISEIGSMLQMKKLLTQ